MSIALCKQYELLYPVANLKGEVLRLKVFWETYNLSHKTHMPHDCYQ